MEFYTTKNSDEGDALREKGWSLYGVFVDDDDPDVLVYMFCKKEEVSK